MATYTFGTWIDIEADDEDQALSLYSLITKNTFVKNSYCFEWKEVE